MERFISSMIQVLSGDFNIFLLHGPRQHGYKQHFKSCRYSRCSFLINVALVVKSAKSTTSLVLQKVRAKSNIFRIPSKFKKGSPPKKEIFKVLKFEHCTITYMDFPHTVRTSLNKCIDTHFVSCKIVLCKK